MNQKKAIIALCLLVPVPSIGVIAAMIIFPDSTLGSLIFGASKLWVFALPIFWLKFVEKGTISLSPPKNGGFGIGLLSGLLISVLILVGYLIFGNFLIDSQFLVKKLTEVGLASRGVYIAGAAYWILINSVLEEYLWRWFCVKQCRALMGPYPAAICSALFFTLHHIVAMSIYLGPVAVFLCSAGVFIGGAIWSAMYIRYRSIWPGYLSHAIVDLCIFGIGAAIIFGYPNFPTFKFNFNSPSN